MMLVSETAYKVLASGVGFKPSKVVIIASDVICEREREVGGRGEN